MFGYVLPCKMELKLKDYEKFNGYYCGLCKTIKSDFGNLPRFVLNYDMTFLAILLDALDSKPCKFSREHCIVHPVKKKTVLKDSKVLHYTAFCNIVLAYYKLLDNVKDDSSVLSKLNSNFLKLYIKKCPVSLKEKAYQMGEMLGSLYSLEKDDTDKSVDEISHSFAELTGYILSSYFENSDFNDILRELGYNLGKWIYLIDCYDDLKDDMQKKKYNTLNAVLNKEKKSYEEFAASIKDRIDFTLTTSARKCLEALNKLPLKKNEELLYNILQFGLIEKMDKVFKRSENYE